MNVHTLQNSDNYKKSLNNNTHEIFSKYISVINEFIIVTENSIYVVSSNISTRQIS